MNKTSVVLKDGSSYVGYLETFHMLHCVVSGPQNRSRSGKPSTICSCITSPQKRFYQFGNREYYPDVQAMDGFNPAHIGETSSNRRPCVTMF